MDRQRKEQEIRQSLETFKNQFENAMKHQGLIPRIELDLMMTTIRNLYEQLYQLQNSVDQPLEVENSFQLTEPESMSAMKELLNEESTIPEITSTITKEEVQTPIALNNEKTAIVPEETTTTINEAIVVESTTAEIKTTINNTKSNSALTDPVNTLASSFSGKKTLHDTISVNKNNKSLADKLQSKPLTDLKKSIGMNEKFVFVNELFEGDQKVFNENLDQLNNFTEYEQARRHLFETLASSMKWNVESKAFSDLSDLIKRRFNA